MSDMPPIDYWLPWWWDHIGRGFPRKPVDINPQIQQNIAIQSTEVNRGGLPPGGGPGGSPPPAAGAAAVAVDDDVVEKVRRLKRIEERQKRMMRR